MSTLIDRIAKINKQFPYLLPLIENESDQIDEKYLTYKIHVSVADGEVLYQVPKVYTDQFWKESDDHHFVGQNVVTAYAVDEEDNVIRSFTWSKEKKYAFLKEVTKVGDNLKAIVLFDKYSWYYKEEYCFENNIEEKTGDLSDIECYIHIIKEPKLGYQALIKDSDLSKNVIIKDVESLFQAAHKDKDSEAIKAITALDQLSKDLLSPKIRNPLLKKIINGNYGGMSGEYGETTLQTDFYDGLGGHDIVEISLAQDEHYISFRSNLVSLQHFSVFEINCDIETAKRLIQDVQDNWDIENLSPDEEPSYY